MNATAAQHDALNSLFGAVGGDVNEENPNATLAAILRGLLFGAVGGDVNEEAKPAAVMVAPRLGHGFDEARRQDVLFPFWYRRFQGFEPLP